VKLVDWLLKAGATSDVEAMGYTPLDLAKMRGHDEIIANNQNPFTSPCN